MRERGSQPPHLSGDGRNRPEVVIAASRSGRHDGHMRRIAILAFDGVQTLDVTGPFEVFSIANRLRGSDEYSVEIVAPETRPLRTGSGLAIVPDRATSGVRGPLDPLLVAGGAGGRRAVRDGRLGALVTRPAARSRRVASVCTGAYMLAEAG